MGVIHHGLTVATRHGETGFGSRGVFWLSPCAIIGNREQTLSMRWSGIFGDLNVTTMMSTCYLSAA